MIPIRLELKNFLPYRSPDAIIFEGIHLACLTGPNGAGKSSLLDAMSWALWGKSRAKRDEELIHLGQKEMYVQLDFEQEGVLYRVVRRRTRSRRAQGQLDLFVLQEDEAPLTINEPNMRATQDKINTILRLDYETFINSAFLQQGRADAFTMKTPAERKRILSEILGLERWEVYETRVKEQLKRITSEVEVLKMRLQEIDDELAKEPQYIKDMENAQVAHEEAQQALGSAQTRLDEVAHAPDALKRTQEQQASHERRLKEYERDLEAVTKDITRHEENIKTHQQVTEQREQIEAGYAELQQARETQTELAQQLQQISDLDQNINDLDKQISEARAELENDRSGYEARIEELERTLDANSLTETETVQQDIAVLEDLERQREAVYQQIGQLNEERSGLKATQQALTDDGQGINERLERLEATEGATCPLCGQRLTAKHRTKIVAQLTDERDEKRELYRSNKERVQIILQDVETFQVQMDEMASELKLLPALRERAGALHEQMERAGEAQTRIDKEKAGLAEVVKTLEAEAFAADVREQMVVLKEQREQIGYNRDTHDETREKLEEYQAFDRQQTELQVSLNALPGEEEALESAHKRQQRIQKAKEEEQSALDNLTSEIDELTLLVQEERRRREEVNSQRTAENVAYQRLVSAQQEIKALENQRSRKVELSERYDNTLYKEALYKELRLAFSKNGIPAMIIETAIPELEAEANDLLARMTDGRMNLKLTTQREKVTGGMAETLDIEIADELGTRGYELYSGGEAFRINFAIRVALSKMLARRAGAHLRTLFIDEGFGSQDDDGKNKLVEAITAIQQDFDLILVITHIDELRDSFPVHVIVEKTGDGSMVRMM